MEAAFAITAALVTTALLGRWLHAQLAEDDRRTALGLELAQLAEARGWGYQERQPGLASRVPEVPGGQQDRPAHHVVTGDHQGREFTAFGYARMVIGTWQGAAVVAQYAVVVLDLGTVCPPISIRASRRGRRMAPIADQTGEPKVTAIDPAEFRRHFSVTTASPQHANDLLRPGVVEVIARNRDLSWHFHGATLTVVRRGRQSAARLDTTLDAVSALLEQVPPPVWHRMRGEPC